MKKFIILFLSLTFVVSAAFVPVERAQKVAENYYQNYAPVSEKGNAVQKILTKEYLGQLTWYVFRFTKGFVIVSADDAVRAILGYSFDGKIDEDIYNMNNPFVHRFSFYDKQIVHTVRENGYVDASAQKEWKNIENKFFPANSTAKLHRDPLLETMWHQNYPFNNQCPSGYPSGSTAIAMAQIMRYHGSPRTGWGSAYYIDNTGDSTGVHSVNYNDQYYDWSLMTTLDGNDMTADEINEVSKLVYQVGVSTKTDYNNDISTASLEDAGNAFEGYFGYGDLYHGPVYENLGTITEPSFFNETITGYINGHCPLLWGNLNASFVLDGYNINSESGIYEYHFNWGWGGAYDGWFWINDLTPGSNDYTAFQECVYHLYPYWPYAMWAPPQSLQCTITDLENVTMTWEWDTGSEYLILSRFDILLDGELIDSVPDSVMSYYFEGVCVGEHTFTAEAVFGYEFYPEWYSSPSGVTLEILPEENFPVPYFTQEASAELYNRQKIELAWAKPFCGTEYINEGFETGTGNYEVVTDGWIQKGSDNCPPSSWNDLTDAGWKYISKYGGTYYYKNTYEGIWAAYCNYFYGDDNAPFTYLISSDQLSVTGDPVLSFWIKSGTFDSDLQIVKYTGDFTETDPSVYTEIISVVSPDTLGTWEYKYVHLPEGNYRIGIVKDTGKGWSIIDNLFLGSDTYPDGNQPVSYDIYRNDILADNVPVSGLYEQYEDKTFTENWNEYYIRAIYPAGSSLKSKPTKVYINANPVPLSLRGTYDNTNSKVDLSWYYPGHYPPHWFGYNYESDTYSYFEWDYDSRYLQKCVILYDPLDFDMTFPIHIERVGASFYEDTNNDNYWTTDQFRFIIAEGSFSSEDIIYTSPWLTADPSGKWCDHKLPETLTLNEKWYVAVEQGDPATGTPSIMLNLHHTDTDEPVWHSLFQSSSSPTSAGSWQALNYKDYSISCYGYNDESVITKQNISDTAIDISDNTVKPFKQNTSFINVKPDRETRFNEKYSTEKGLDSYNIYRNGSLLGNTSDKNYTDTDPGITDNTYYITAVYTDPVGESESSNEITLGPPAIITLPASITGTAYAGENSSETFDIGNTGLGILNYDMNFEYTDAMSQSIEPSEAKADFASALSPYVDSGTGIAWIQNTDITYNVDGTPYAFAEAPVTSVSTICYLTSGVFDGTHCEYLYFDQVLNVLNSSSSFAVDYSLDGGSTWEPGLYRVSATTAGSWGSPIHMQKTLPSASPTMVIRFTADLASRSGNYAALDNVSVAGTEILINPWFSFDGETAGTVDAGSSVSVTCAYDATSLLQGEYHGNITVASNDTTSTPDVIPVTFTVNPSDIENNIPVETSLYQNYPNPFNPVTNISFSLASDTNVTLKIFNTAGQLVTKPVDKFMKKGYYKINLDSSVFSGGVYFYTLEADGKTFTRKMTVIK